MFFDVFLYDTSRPRPKYEDFSEKLDFFSKRSKTAWEYSRDHMDLHSSGESA